MGFYIETGGNTRKAEYIASHYDGKIIPRPNSFSDIPTDKGLICVVNNVGLGFEAAAFCFDADEFTAFTDSRDYRPKKWVVMDLEKAKELSGYLKFEKRK